MKIINRPIFALLVAVLIVLPAYQVKASSQPNKEKILQTLAKKSKNTLAIEWNEQTQTPSLLTGTLSSPSSHSPQWIAYEFLKQVRHVYGIQNPIRDMKVTSVIRKQDRINVRLQHCLFNTAVWGDWLDIYMNSNGVIQRVQGTIHPNLEKKLFNRPMYPAITETKAIEKANASVDGQLAPTLPLANRYYLPSRRGTPLIYVVQIHYSEPQMVVTTFIHSVTGTIIGQDKI